MASSSFFQSNAARTYYSQAQVDAFIAAALANTLTPADVAAAVAAATAGLFTQNQVDSLIAVALASGTSNLFTQNQVNILVSAAVTSATAGLYTQAQVDALLAAYIVSPLAAPAFTVNPVITGTTTQGQTLTLSNGTITGNPVPTPSRQWKRNGTAITGAIGTTYALAAADVGSVITGTVTAVNTQGTANATSAATTTVLAAVTPNPPQITSSATQTVVENDPFALILTANEDVAWTIIGGPDASYFDVSQLATGASSFDYELPVDVGADNIYNITVRATSIATGLFTDQAMSVAVTSIGGVGGASALQFALSPSTVNLGSAVGTTIGTLSQTTTGTRVANFTLSATTIQFNAAVGATVGTLS